MNAFTSIAKVIDTFCSEPKQTRGYESQGSMWSPGYFRMDLEQGQKITFVATTETWDILHSLTPDTAWEAEIGRRETLISQANPAARRRSRRRTHPGCRPVPDCPRGRTEDAARAHAAGEELRTVIAGYHWFTDWGRDTMISLEGLTLVTGRVTEAGWILRTFSQYIRDGLIPNMFPEGQKHGSITRPTPPCGSSTPSTAISVPPTIAITLKIMVPKLIDIVDWHLRGTDFGIHVDPNDGLLSQGAEGYQLTWMDAKVGDWVVTPRRGKAVEINALWYNALCLLSRWVADVEGPDAARGAPILADRVRDSFNTASGTRRRGFLFDVVDGEKGDDPSCRPNQIFALSLPQAVLDQSRWQQVLEAVKDKLLTPVGLRSLSPGNPDYKAKYDGDLRARDAAYHQGTVWAWLIGPFINAWLRVYPDRIAEARAFVDGFGPHLSEACIGSISEVFDAEQPHTARACIAQAWSVAEVLRCLVLVADLERSQTAAPVHEEVAA